MTLEVDGCSLAQKGQLMPGSEDMVSAIFVNFDILEEVVLHVAFGDGELQVGWLIVGRAFAIDSCISRRGWLG